MKNYRFVRDITVDGTPYQGGQVVAGDEVPPGSLRSMLRMRQIVETDDPPSEPPEPPPPVPTKVPARKVKK